MKHPQTLAEKLYVQFPTSKLKSIKEYACCAFTFMWCMGIESDDAEAILTVGSLLDKGILDPDCTVYWDKMSRHLTGRGCNKQNKDITTIKGIKERTPVKYEYINKSNGKKYSHWVGVENGRIRFNSMEVSQCVLQGKPVEARILQFTGEEKCQKK